MGECEACAGEGGWCENYGDEWTVCPYCKGTGKATLSMWFWTHVPVWFAEWYADKFYREVK